MSVPFEPLTALQRHVAYFDPQNTGVITVGNTARQIRALGVGFGWTWFLTLLIHGALQFKLGFDSKLRLFIRKIDDGIHAGDTGIFGGDGELRYDVFEQAFEKAHGKAGPDAWLTHADLYAFMLRDEKWSPAAMFSWAEAKLLLAVAKNRQETVKGALVDVITKRRLLQFYEGRLLKAVARCRRVRKLTSG
ncbi:MAG: hypothetical protein JNL21_03960 [Myxococcales bacterium]|nr:hypothetical protein [Myxococcales bacterium]